MTGRSKKPLAPIDLSPWGPYFLAAASWYDGMPFEIVQTITTDLPTMQTGVSSLADIDYGGANWASSNEALYLTATGEGFQPWLGPQNCPAIPDEMMTAHIL